MMSLKKKKNDFCLTLWNNWYCGLVEGGSRGAILPHHPPPQHSTREQDDAPIWYLEQPSWAGWLRRLVPAVWVIKTSLMVIDVLEGGEAGAQSAHSTAGRPQPTVLYHLVIASLLFSFMFLCRVTHHILLHIHSSPGVLSCSHHWTIIPSVQVAVSPL